MNQSIEPNEPFFEEQVVEILEFYEHYKGEAKISAIVRSLTNYHKKAIDQAVVEELKSLDEFYTDSQSLEKLEPGYTQQCIPTKVIFDRITELEKQ